MDELYRSENLVVRRVPAQDQNRWVVTFDNYGIGHGFDREGFGESFLKAQGISAIHVMGRREDWYQYPDLAAALKTVRAAVKGASRVMTYGSSMGAYAAVRFADAAGAHAALALSPQYSIDPAVAPFEKRWLQDAERISFLPDLNGPIQSKARQIIVYDPMTIDRRHAAMIASDIPVEELRLPYVDHPAGSFLVEIGALAPLVKAALDGSVDMAALRRMVRAERATSAIYFAHLAAAQPASRRRLAIQIGRKAVELNPSSSHALRALGVLLTAEGQYDEALDLLGRARAVGGDHHPLQIAYADALHASGRAEEALIIARAVVAKDDLADLAHLHAWRGMIAWIAESLEEALESMEVAVRLHPGNEEYRAMAAAYRKRLAQENDVTPARSLFGRVRDWLAVRGA